MTWVHLAVVENTSASAVIYDADASDVDAGYSLSFSVSGTDADKIVIDADDGEVRLLATSDFET